LTDLPPILVGNGENHGITMSVMHNEGILRKIELSGKSIRNEGEHFFTLKIFGE